MQQGFAARVLTRRLRFAVACAAAAVSASAFVPATSAAHGARHDADRDGLTNAFERTRSHTNPRRADTDRDRLKDKYEVKRSHTNPRRRDTDHDGLEDRYEVKRSHTDPRDRDTDGDGLGDGYEVRHGLDPLTPEAPAPATPGPVDPPLDLLAPDTAIDSGPSGTTGSDAATFTFRSSEPLSTYSCRLDGGAWSACSSPETYADLAGGAHTFEVAASDIVGNRDATPASRTWTVDVPPPPPPADTTAPQTTLGSAPSGTVASASASFAFSSSESGSTFRCRLDGAAWASCSSPKSYANLGNGSHTFAVAATDAAGNADASPASRTWTVNVASPPPSGGTNCIADPSACGYPDVENTGVLPNVARQAVSGNVRLDTPGQVYENKTLTGKIDVYAPNVTIRNVKLIMTNEWYGIEMHTNGSQPGNAKSTLIENVEIDGNGHYEAKGIAFNEYTARRVFFHNGSDCAHLGENATVEDSLCVLGPDANGDGIEDGRGFCSDNGPHYDGLQSDFGHDQVYRHNTIRNACSQTSAILISTNTSPIRNVTITDNLMAGGGYTLYCDAGPDVQGTEIVTGNRIAKTFFGAGRAGGSDSSSKGGGYWGPTTECDDAGTYSGNVWDDTGAALP